jgi:hypothetical protein
MTTSTLDPGYPKSPMLHWDAWLIELANPKRPQLPLSSRAYLRGCRHGKPRWHPLWLAHGSSLCRSSW